MTLKEFSKKLFAPWFWGNITAMAVVVGIIIFGVWHGIAWYTHHGEEIEIPDIRNMSVEDASFALEHMGLVPIVADSGYNKKMRTGVILFQQPRPGMVVKSGREIYLTVNSTYSPTLTLPDIADNCDAREAEVKLVSMGFRLGPIEYVPGEKDWVLKVKCRGRIVYKGDKIPIEAPLVLVVGNTDPEEDDIADDSAADAQHLDMIDSEDWEW